jgi:DNA-binding winged helix-turn-helix (wHTH) protein
MRVRFGAFLFDSTQRELTRGGASVPLSPKAFALLEALIEAAPAAVSKEALYERLWPRTFVEAGNLHNLASDIRTAFGDPSVLRTVHRFGYAFEPAAVPDEIVRYSIVVGKEEIPLHGGTNVIGRDAGDAVVLNAPEVSRHHARLVVNGPEVTLEDLGSKNGTFVGTTRVTTPVALREGDEIVIGKTRLRLHAMRALASTVTGNHE